MKKIIAIDSVEDAIYDLIHHSRVPAKAQAAELGVSYSRFMNCCIDSAETAYHHSRWIIPQTLRTRNYVLVDYIERELGRVAIPVGMNDEVSGRDLSAEVLLAAKELGEMAQAIQESLARNKFGNAEIARCKKESWDLVSQAARVFKKIEAMSDQD